MKTFEDKSLQALLPSGTGEQIYAHFSDHEVTPEDGDTAMDWLGEHRISVRNRVLCHYFGVACYHMGTSCFSSDAAPGDKDKWFVSVASNSELDTPEFKTKLTDSQDEAEAHAVAVFGLVARFNDRRVDALPL